MRSIQVFGFDDVDFIGRNIRSITDAYTRMENKIAFRVNEDKTKAWKLNRIQN